MPVQSVIVGPRGRNFWNSFDPDDFHTVREALKEEFRRPEPAHQIHSAGSRAANRPPNVLDGKIGFYCMKDCLVFLLRGAIHIDGQAAFGDEGCAYVVKDEKMIGLGGSTTIFVMEEGEMKGICARETKKEQEEMRREQEAWEKKRNLIGHKVSRKLRGERKNEEGRPQCQQQ